LGRKKAAMEFGVENYRLLSKKKRALDLEKGKEGFYLRINGRKKRRSPMSEGKKGDLPY